MFKKRELSFSKNDTIPYDEFRVTVMVDYDSHVLGTQHASMYHIGEFKENISPCRTFVFLRELEYLAKHSDMKKAKDIIIKTMKELYIHKDQINNTGYTKMLWKKRHKK